MYEDILLDAILYSYNIQSSSLFDTVLTFVGIGSLDMYIDTLLSLDRQSSSGFIDTILVLRRLLWLDRAIPSTSSMFITTPTTSSWISLVPSTRACR